MYAIHERELYNIIINMLYQKYHCIKYYVIDIVQKIR